MRLPEFDPGFTIFKLYDFWQILNLSVKWKLNKILKIKEKHGRYPRVLDTEQTLNKCKRDDDDNDRKISHE